MSDRKSYGQFCGLARSLDRVGDRWTLLVVRELLLGSKSFRELQEALPGVSPSLLTERIASLVDDGLARRNDAPMRSKAVCYSLTDAGEALEPVVLALIRWGRQWMMDGPGADRSDPRWAPLALRALLDGLPAPRGAVVTIDVDGTWVTIRAKRGRREVAAGRQARAAATLSTNLPAVLAVAAGALRLDDANATITGDDRVVAELLAPAQAES